MADFRLDGLAKARRYGLPGECLPDGVPYRRSGRFSSWPAAPGLRPLVPDFSPPPGLDGPGSGRGLAMLESGLPDECLASPRKARQPESFELSADRQLGISGADRRGTVDEPEPAELILAATAAARWPAEDEGDRSALQASWLRLYPARYRVNARAREGRRTKLGGRAADHRLVVLAG